jgi:predicted RNase H-like HicB family nuclease
MTAGVFVIIVTGKTASTNVSEGSTRLLVTLDRDETGMIVAQCPAIPGCISQGATEEEALRNVEEAIRGCLESRAAHGMPLTVAVREVEVAL